MSGENTIAFISGLKDELGMSDPANTPSPPLLPNVTAGDTQLGDVTVNLSQPEKALVGKWPALFNQLSKFLGKWKWIVWPLVFVLFCVVFGAFRKRKV